MSHFLTREIEITVATYLYKVYVYGFVGMYESTEREEIQEKVQKSLESTLQPLGLFC